MSSARMYVCMYVCNLWMCAPLAPKLLFKSCSIIGRCPVNLNIRARKIGALQMGPKTQNGDFLENDSDDFD
jgi:hypothetical protein